jgi:regulatory protein
MLGRRELSEAQIRQRLARRGHAPEAIDEAVARLVEERAIDDNRVAEAIARMETGIRKRGKLRVRRKIDDLLESALAKRLRRGATITEAREFNRLYRYLVGQGFEPQRVLARLKRESKT